MLMSAERIARIKREPWARDCEPLIACIEALEADLATSEAARERAEEALNDAQGLLATQEGTAA